MYRGVFSAFVLTLFAVAPATARADGLSVGVGIDASLDMPDPKGTMSYSKGFAGVGLMIPVRYDLSDFASFRATVRTAFAPGHDRVSWGTPIPSTSATEPAEVRHASVEHFALLAAAGLTVGLEAATKETGLSPYFGVETGPVLVNTYHSFDADSGTSDLLKDLTPEQQASSGTIEPFTSKLTLLTDLHAGVRTRGESGVGFWAEAGYAAAFVGAQHLKNTPDAINAQRDPYGWNALRLGFGVQFAM